MRYAVDLRHQLQAPGGCDDSGCAGYEKTTIRSSRPWECGNPEGISKECGKGGKPAFLAFHAFHTLSFPWPAFRPGDPGFTSASTSATGRTHKEVLVVIVVDEYIGDLTPIQNITNGKSIYRYLSRYCGGQLR